MQVSIGKKIRKQKRICPICTYSGSFPEFLFVSNKNKISYICPSCKNLLIIKNTRRDLLLGVMVVCLFVSFFTLSYFVLSGFEMSLISLILVAIISSLIKKKSDSVFIDQREKSWLD